MFPGEYITRLSKLELTKICIEDTLLSIRIKHPIIKLNRKVIVKGKWIKISLIK